MLEGEVSSRNNFNKLGKDNHFSLPCHFLQPKNICPFTNTRPFSAISAKMVKKGQSKGKRKEKSKDIIFTLRRINKPGFALCFQDCCSKCRDKLLLQTYRCNFKLKFPRETYRESFWKAVRASTKAIMASLCVN
ncbi:uncharacterized protein [Spinacia oleracea]|uniref:FLZ-type domain-containing protein n=1 Tax=Spinacia oleracea TaxID=3562 RepID=A0ABM3QNU2_SPIOL|nr:uncharacterized protein LOC130461105 [Spinacia oleracea]